MIWRLVVVAAALVIVPAAHGQRASADSLRVTFFDVGQGDAALIQTPDGKRVLVDAGPGGAQIVAQLAALEVRTLDLVVASHNHADHIGGMADVFGAVKVREYMDNGLPALTRAYRRTVETVEAHKDLKLRAATVMRDYRLGKTTVRVLIPPHVDETQNDNSIGLWVQFGSFSVIFTGDAEEPELGFWLSLYRLPRASVVKASHHGSTNGVSEAWMDRVSPKVVVISVGANNQYGHPASSVLLGWSAIGARVYRTDAVGTITISAAEDGGFTVKTSSGEMPWMSK